VSAITSATRRRAPIRKAESVADDAETDAIAAAGRVFFLMVRVGAFLTGFAGTRALDCRCTGGWGAGGGGTDAGLSETRAGVTGAEGAGGGGDRAGGGAGGGAGGWASCLGGDVCRVGCGRVEPGTGSGLGPVVVRGAGSGAGPSASAGAATARPTEPSTTRIDACRNDRPKRVTEPLPSSRVERS
jgi:hypothetical protein